MGLKLVTPPATDPVTLADAKAHLRIDFTDDDASVQVYLDAAIAFVDGPNGAIGRALIDQTWDLYLDAFPAATSCNRFLSTVRASSIEIPLPPLIEVVGVFYTDGDGNEQQMDAADYVVDTTGEFGNITLADGAAWPTPAEIANAVRIRFRAGYLDISSPPVAAVPDTIKAAILLIMGSLYSNRENVVPGGPGAPALLPWGAEQLLALHDVRRPMA